MLSQLSNGFFTDSNSQAVYPVVIVPVFREFAFDLVVNDDAVVISYRLNLCIFDS